MKENTKPNLYLCVSRLCRITSYNVCYTKLLRITPVVNITPNSPVKNYYIKEQNDKGFTLAAENTTGFEFNWMAIANYTENNKEPEQEYSLDPALMSQLKVNEAKKEQIHRLLFRSQQTKLEIKGATGDSVKVNT